MYNPVNTKSAHNIPIYLIIGAASILVGIGITLYLSKPSLPDKIELTPLVAKTEPSKFNNKELMQSPMVITNPVQELPQIDDTRLQKNKEEALRIQHRDSNGAGFAQIEKNNTDLNKNPYLNDEDAISDELKNLPGMATPPPALVKNPRKSDDDLNTIYDPTNNQRKNLSAKAVKFEKTGLKVQHTITALFPATDKTAPQKIRLDVPVLHESRELAWSNSELLQAHNTLKKIRNYQKKMQAIQKEGIQLLNEWNSIVKKGSPESILLPDSPSLIENQGGQQVLGTLNPALGSKTKLK